MAFFTESCKLPSNGKLYGGVSEVTMRNITTAEEKLLLGSTAGRVLEDVVAECITDPKTLKVEDLILPDLHFLLIKLRVISYGNIYKVYYRCPNCGKTSEYDIDLDTLEVSYLDDTFEEVREFELPKSKDTISISIPTAGALNEADRFAKKLHKKFPEAKGDFGYTCRLMTNICAVNGEKKGQESLRLYVDAMHALDVSYMRKQINSLKVGFKTLIEEECPVCAEDVSFILPISEGFFRADFED